LPWGPISDEAVVVQTGEPCYGAAAWAGFTQGIVKNAPNYLFFTYEVWDPNGVKICDVQLEDSDTCWTHELWDPSSCELIGELTPFNPRLGAKPYMMGWFTPTFVPPVAGTYQVHSTMLQTRPATDLMLVEGMKRPIVWMPGFMELDWEFVAE